MLTELRIENFKAFGKEQRIPIRPITLLFGPNSSGKTSVLQSLLLLKQTVDDNKNYDEALKPVGEIIDIDDYYQFINNHDINKRLSIGFKISTDHDFNFGLSFFENEDMSSFCDEENNLIADCKFSFIFSKSKKIELEDYSFSVANMILGSYRMSHVDSDKELNDAVFYNLFGEYNSFLRLKYLNDKHPLIERNWNEFKSKIKKKLKDLNRELNKLNYLLKNSKKNDRKSYAELSKRKKEICNILVKITKYSFDDFLNDLSLNLNNTALLAYHFLPCWDKYSTDDVFEIIGDAADAYSKDIGIEQTEDNGIGKIAWRVGKTLGEKLNKIIYLGPVRQVLERQYKYSGEFPSGVGKIGEFTPTILLNDKRISRKVNKWLEKFEIAYNLSANISKDQNFRNLFCINLIDKINNIKVSPTDVGFGISQLLPIIVQGVLSTNNLILIEQPELHLHPRLQAEIGTFLAHCIKEKNQFIVETHSEHLILRLQKLIRQKVLKPDDVSIIYISKENDGSKAQRLHIDEEGDFIDEWPDGFFPERMDEIS
ncbi:MAG: DUF3696 domain-containing protein [Candidatus Schekmanbacteria bacterium]|nr:DUF3696 domain-containing protein [Candidatus Schekmanbacteria bacterium]